MALYDPPVKISFPSDSVDFTTYITSLLIPHMLTNALCDLLLSNADVNLVRTPTPDDVHIEVNVDRLTIRRVFVSIHALMAPFCNLWVYK